MLFGGIFPFIKPNKKYSKELAFFDITNNDLKIPDSPKRSKEIIQLLERMLIKNPD